MPQLSGLDAFRCGEDPRRVKGRCILRIDLVDDFFGAFQAEPVCCQQVKVQPLPHQWVSA